MREQQRHNYTREKRGPRVGVQSIAVGRGGGDASWGDPASLSKPVSGCCLWREVRAGREGGVGGGYLPSVQSIPGVGGLGASASAFSQPWGKEGKRGLSSGTSPAMRVSVALYPNTPTAPSDAGALPPQATRPQLPPPPVPIRVMEAIEAPTRPPMRRHRPPVVGSKTPAL